jgi:CubicO group peptidase (beta-lactamase class C family)
MMMNGHPPLPQEQVTVANWLEAPYNRWSFWHVRELFPTQLVSRGSLPVRPLPASPVDHLGSVPLTRVDGSSATVNDVMADTFTDAVLVVQNGNLVSEWYAAEGAATRQHLMMSVSKSIVGCVAAVLVEQGLLDPSHEITAYVPELAASGFAGATVRHLLDMRSGVAFREEYTNPEAEVRILDEWTGWRPSHPDEEVRGLYNFLTTLTADQEHGGSFSYRSAETDVLGWVCERASHHRMADLVSNLLWEPMGAEFDAAFICDGIGTAVHDGGFAATARDIARFGQLLLDEGTVPLDEGGYRSVVSPSWIHQGWAVDADAREAFANSRAEQAFPGGWYRNQFWFRPGKHGDVLLALGIYGQMLHVNRHTGTICVKFSSWPDAQNPAYLNDTVRAFDAIGGALVADAAPGERQGVAGVVSGLRRQGVTSATPASSGHSGAI